MDITGNTIRYFSALQSGSFSFTNIQTNAVWTVSGNSASGKALNLGFTGITGNYNWEFSLKNGKIYDPEGRFFGSYNSSDILNISGNFTLTGYDYYLDNELICAVGQKPNIAFNGWYANPISGASGQVTTKITTAPITCNIDMASGFYLGGIWSGSFYHNNTGVISIRSGELRFPDASEFQITGTGLDFNNGTNILGTGYRTITLAHTGLQDRTGVFNVNVRVYTDFGYADIPVSGQGVLTTSGTISNSISYQNSTSATSNFGESGAATWFFSTNYIDSNGNELEKPFYAELSYLSGITGAFSRVTGINITNPGSSYTTAPYIVVTPTGRGYPFASGIALLDTDTQTVTGINWIQSGVYTGNILTLSTAINGGDGTSFACSALFDTSYSKRLDDFINFKTGLFIAGNNGITCARNHTLSSGLGQLSDSDSIVFMKIVADPVYDNAPWQYMIKASGLKDSYEGISIYSGSGLIYSN